MDAGAFGAGKRPAAAPLCQRRKGSRLVSTLKQAYACLCQLLHCRSWHVMDLVLLHVVRLPLVCLEQASEEAEPEDLLPRRPQLTAADRSRPQLRQAPHHSAVFRRFLRWLLKSAALMGVVHASSREGRIRNRNMSDSRDFPCVEAPKWRSNSRRCPVQCVLYDRHSN